MSAPSFSVVIPTHGRPQYLDQTLRSVLDQTVDDLEVIVVDDASPEPTVVPTTDPRVRVVRRAENGGAAAARNTGISEARGRWVAFCDDDDLLTPDRLESCLPALQDAAVVLTWMARLDDPARRPMDRRDLRGSIHDEVLTHPVPHVGTTIVSRDAVVLFDPRFRVSEDVEWWVRQSAAVEVATVPEVTYLFREHGGERQTARIEDRYRCRLALLQTHHEYFRRRPRAAAYHWRRAGGLALELGDRRAARAAFTRALWLRPSVRDATHVARTFLPGTTGPTTRG